MREGVSCQLFGANGGRNEINILMLCGPMVEATSLKSLFLIVIFLVMMSL